MPNEDWEEQCECALKGWGASMLSCVQLFCNPMDCSLPGSMEFSRQEYWSGLPFPPPGHLSDPRIKPASPALAGGFFTTEPRKPSRS